MSDYNSGGDDATINGSVKWFSAEKGYGFVAPADGSPDVFLHISALKRANFDDAPKGSTIVCQVQQGQKGRQVSQVLELDVTTADPVAPRRADSFEDRPRGGGYGDRPQGGYGDRPQGGYGRPQGGYGDRPQGGGYADRTSQDRPGGGYGDRPRGGGGGYGDRPQGGYGGGDRGGYAGGGDRGGYAQPDRGGFGGDRGGDRGGSDNGFGERTDRRDFERRGSRRRYED